MIKVDQGVEGSDAAFPAVKIILDAPALSVDRDVREAKARFGGYKSAASRKRRDFRTPRRNVMFSLLSARAVLNKIEQPLSWFHDTIK